MKLTTERELSPIEQENAALKKELALRDKALVILAKQIPIEYPYIINMEEHVYFKVTAALKAAKGEGK